MNFDVNRVKICTTAPKENVKEIKTAIFDAGAGVIGNYSRCSTSIKTIGSFVPEEKSNPYFGEKNKLNYVIEEKIEVICDVVKVKKVIKKIREVHPYEEPEIDIIPLIDETEFE